MEDVSISLHLLSVVGDQVLEWNGRVLQGATFNEVYNIILESKPESQVELVVSRPIRWVKGQRSPTTYIFRNSSDTLLRTLSSVLLTDFFVPQRCFQRSRWFPHPAGLQ